MVHMLKSGVRWCDCPPGYGPSTTIYNRWSRQGIWLGMFEADWTQRRVGNGCDRRHPRQGAPLGRRRKKGAFAQATGVSRGGRTSKPPGLTGPRGRPRLLMLSAGDINDMTTASSQLEQAGCRFDRLIADRGL